MARDEEVEVNARKEQAWRPYAKYLNFETFSHKVASSYSIRFKIEEKNLKYRPFLKLQ